MISRKFDAKEATKRIVKDRNAQDEEGGPLLGQLLDLLEAAHIPPHALMRGDRNSQLVCPLFTMMS